MCVVGIVNKIFWVFNKFLVNWIYCYCDCFDIVFKGL